MRSFAATVSALEAAHIPVKTVTDAGALALTTNGARLIALSLGEAGENLLYTHPRLAESDLVCNHPEELPAGIGGDRLWFSPEVRYHWRGTPDWVNFSNNCVPAESDPGTYAFIDAGPSALGVAAQIALPTTDDSPLLPIEVSRFVGFADPPLSRDHSLMRGVDCVGVCSDWRLELDKTARVGRVALWHILQAQIGARAVVPITRGEECALTLYSPKSGGWAIHRDHVAWRFGGTANAKFGLSVRNVTGRAGFIRKLSDGRACLIVRKFPVRREAAYGDHPYGVERDDQVLQLWDGFGFGELEYHSRVLDAERGPRMLAESDTIWAFAGESGAIAALGGELLGVDLYPYVKDIGA
ncbi:hypothetical protein [Bradyrhizobium sp. 169]|uniref:hypothetical protein n=1 Tax=Bradyrhizobium sp. 169 TaxID=2782640 RepID=UPI001FFA25BA|nr:hypothetical protein [Bradyrhizobium sp. 169]MCK1589089.1 hypothetical protein [Bradyrhizobium sp. 169]